MTTLSFKPKAIVKRLLAAVPERARDVLVNRYGLSDDAKRHTLEEIGGRYGITRERVRQIENYALEQVRVSEAYRAESAVFKELEAALQNLGGVMAEKDLLNEFAKDESTRRNIHFLLTVGEQFSKSKEDDSFEHRWYLDEALSDKVQSSLRNLYASLDDDDLIPETEMVSRFFEHLKNVSDKYKEDEIAKRWLRISKELGKNPLGEWGKTSSSSVRAKGMRDLAFLVIRRQGSPMHFREVAKDIERLFDKRAHVATCHNELIKDSRFVLVGRGLYALREWGYMSGVVRDVIKTLVKKHGPMTREEIIEKVLKERYVKPNTIVVNLQNPKYFRKNPNAKYSVVEK